MSEERRTYNLCGFEVVEAISVPEGTIRILNRHGEIIAVAYVGNVWNPDEPEIDYSEIEGNTIDEAWKAIESFKARREDNGN